MAHRVLAGGVMCGVGAGWLTSKAVPSRETLVASCQSILGRLTYGTVGLVPMSWRLPTLPQLRTNRLGDPLRVITIKSVTHNPSSQPQRHSAGEVPLRACARCAPA